MWCPQRRSPVSDQQRFCGQCGAPITVSAAPIGLGVPERKHVTILFADLTGSLALLERRDPEDVRRLLLGIIDLMIDSVRASGGIVNQVMGDGVMAIFGAPVADEHHALNACIAAARIHEAIARFVEETKATLGTDILTRVGIHSDDVVVGERGEGFDFQDQLLERRRMSRRGSKRWRGQDHHGLPRTRMRWSRGRCGSSQRGALRFVA